MNHRTIITLGIAMIMISMSLIVISFFLMKEILLIFSILIMVVSILLMFILLSIDMFRKDKVLDIETLRNQGFRIVKCNICHQDNVLEDVYCIYCGEKLYE